tara:strand:+ start:205 stop:513 length:309 start_codon:yes stop_codon:yes gene_type:complete
MNRPSLSMADSTSDCNGYTRPKPFVLLELLMMGFLLMVSVCEAVVAVGVGGGELEGAGGGEKGDEAAADLFHGVSFVIIRNLSYLSTSKALMDLLIHFFNKN